MVLHGEQIWHTLNAKWDFDAQRRNAYKIKHISDENVLKLRKDSVFNPEFENILSSKGGSFEVDFGYDGGLSFDESPTKRNSLYNIVVKWEMSDRV